MNREKLMKMASAVRTGGKGSVRRYVEIIDKGVSIILKKHREQLVVRVYARF